MIYIKKKRCSKRLQESLNAVKHSDAWKQARDDDISLLRMCFDSLDKSEIKKLLIDEQHGICAYCMSRINERNIVIDHWMPLSSGKKYVLDYNNFAGCCCGGRNKDRRKELCCEAAKDNEPITINPWDKDMMDNIKYTTDGKIVYTGENIKIKNDINYVLKLNGELDSKGKMRHDTPTKLVENRKQQYKNFCNLMHQMNENNYSQKRIVSELKRHIRKLETQDEYKEYVGVMIYFMKRKIATASKS